MNARRGKAPTISAIRGYLMQPWSRVPIRYRAPLGEFDRLVREDGLTVGVVESLTCGKLVAALGASDGAGEWLKGGIVGYADEVKFELLGSRPQRGPSLHGTSAESAQLDYSRGARTVCRHA